MPKVYFPDPDDSGVMFNLPREVFSDVDEEKEKLEQDEVECSSVSDEAPEDVSFAKSKNDALSLLRAEQESRRLVKEKQKEKLKKIEARLTEQKSEKLKRLEALALKKLPDELLVNLSNTVPQPNKKQKKKKVEKSKAANSHLKFESEHYIPLESSTKSTKFNLAVLETKPWKKTLLKPGQCTAENFREKRLYNSKIRRVHSSTFRHIEDKKKVSSKFCLASNETLLRLKSCVEN